MDADIVQAGREMLEVEQGYIGNIFAFAFEIIEQLAKVALIGIERVARHVALQLKIAHISPYYVFLSAHYQYFGAKINKNQELFVSLHPN